ncbi:MAG: ribosomal RNA small subunit methyltransferase A, partial [bacterium]|nr:ribosomal RNA small subunit methyltransferase A [bacterium]
MGRKLGQHFLRDASILRRIAEAACPDDTGLLIEIGPGRGELTGYLLERAAKVVAIELDSRLADVLRRRFAKAHVLEADVLKTDLAQWGPARIAGNLPYYITSPIIEKVLRLGDLLESAVFLVQEEVADRLTAEPGSRD